MPRLAVFMPRSRPFSAGALCSQATAQQGCKALVRPHSPAPGKGSHILLSFLLSVRAGIYQNFNPARPGGVFYCRKAVTTVPSITPKQERFCQEYIVDYNGAQAAVRAGYAANSARKTASRLLTNADILARVRELQREQTARLALTQDYVLQQLVDTYRCCREPEPVLVYDPDAGGMVESGKYQFDSKGALRALELIGKHLGMYQDKLKLDAKLDTGQLGKVLEQLGAPDG